MNIKKTVQRFANVQNDIDEKIKLLKAVYCDETNLWRQLEALDPNIVVNERVMNLLADSLQMVDNNERLKLFDLEDIKKIYQLLVQYHPNNIQYQLDLISFVYSVLGDEKTALELINEALKLIDDSKKCLLNFLNEMKEK